MRQSGNLRGVATLCTATLVLVSSSATAEAQSLRWRTSPADDRIGLAREIMPDVDSPADALTALARRPDRTHVVLHFADSPSDGDRAALADRGVTLLQPLGSGAYFATLDATRLDAPEAAALTGLIAAEPVQPLYKLHPHFAQGQIPEWASVEEDVPGDPIIGAYLQFHGDVDLQAEGETLAGLYGAVVRDRVYSINALVIELPLSAVPDLAAEDAVQWLEPALPTMIENNDSNRALTQAAAAQTAPYNLDGTGVSVMVYDGGAVRASHQDYGGRATLNDAAPLSNHSTHVAGSIGGNGAVNINFRGMAPNVAIESYGFQWDGQGIFFYTNPGDLEDDYDHAINTRGADIANNSIGTNTETNGFSCSLHGDYGVFSSLIDAIIRGSLGSHFRVIWAAGNERQGSRCDVEGFGDYYSSAPPCNAKNHITVGAVNSNDDSMTSFSSWGPTGDGRLKPDISGPGCQSGGDGGVTSLSGTSDTGYSVACGTSMAAPTVTGLCALILEDYRVQFPAAGDPRNATLKALLAHNAVDRGNTGPDYQFGYGSVRVVDTIDFLRTGRFVEDQVADSSEVNYSITVPGATSVLKLTLAWDDVAAPPNVYKALINDLDLVVIDPLGGRHYPWTLNPANPSAAAVRNQEDHLNNIEQVLVNSPAAGTWTVRVRGYDVPTGPQTFSLTSSVALDAADLQISLPDGAPDTLTPGAAATFDVEITTDGDTLVPGSPTLHVRYDGATWHTAPLTALGGDLYQATLPGPTCAATPEFYVSAQGTISGLVTSPAGAPTNVLTAAAGTENVLVAHDFESDPGWTVTNTSITGGAWNRGVPEPDELGRGNAPSVDGDGSGQCYLTDIDGGNSDVDGGPTRLQTISYAANTLTDPTVSMYVWFSTNLLDADSLVLEFSSNGGGAWTPVQTWAGNTTRDTNGWQRLSYRIADYVAVTNNFRARFSCTDNPNDSVTEAGVDGFRIAQFTCSGSFTDCNGNQIDDATEISSGLAADGNNNGIPDDCDSGCDDADGDGVCDEDDICPGGDDNADADGDGTPDFCDGCPNDPAKTAPGVCGCGVADTDSDGDGTPNCNDGCPNDPVKTAPGACGCGVADTDSDGDGTPNCNDGCPNDPVKTAPGGACGCGVADTDSDGDGTPDCNDGCPNDPAKTLPGACGCGVADTDSDGDGTPDCNDGCPADPAKTDPGVCGCGVADTDSDGDGTPDCNDDCPADPAKTDPGVCGCGVADTDSDGDGTPDCNDGCPADPAKTDPGVCGCGVADTDSDGDGTPDCNDGCPADPDKTDPGVCGCGVSDADSDGDGTLDCIDGCPGDPLKSSPGACGCNVADTDSDGDGTPDCNDNCPNDPAKTSPGECGCDVSDIDQDGDGIADCNDGCPLDPTKSSPGACGCGVADTDSDGDGTPDCNDGCPADPVKTDPGACGCGIAEDVCDCPGDNDGDNDVDLDDLLILLGNFGSSTSPYTGGDADGDADVDLDDLLILLGNFGVACV